MGFWKSRPDVAEDDDADALDSSECNMRTGPKQMAKFCGVILFRSDWAVTRHKWSISKNSVVCKSNGSKLDGSHEALRECAGHTRLPLGRHSRMENISLALPSGSSGRQTANASTSIW